MLKQAADPTMCVASFNGTRTVQTFYWIKYPMYFCASCSVSTRAEADCNDAPDLTNAVKSTTTVGGNTVIQYTCQSKKYFECTSLLVLPIGLKIKLSCNQKSMDIFPLQNNFCEIAIGNSSWLDGKNRNNSKMCQLLAQKSNMSRVHSKQKC